MKERIILFYCMEFNFLKQFWSQISQKIRFYFCTYWFYLYFMYADGTNKHLKHCKYRDSIQHYHHLYLFIFIKQKILWDYIVLGTKLGILKCLINDCRMKSKWMKFHAFIDLMTCVLIIREIAFAAFHWGLFYNDVHIFKSELNLLLFLTSFTQCFLKCESSIKRDSKECLFLLYVL